MLGIHKYIIVNLEHLFRIGIIVKYFIFLKQIYTLFP